MKSETLSLKTFINELDFPKKTQLLFNETSEKKICNCLQLNKQKKNLILIMVKSAFNHL